MSFSVLIGLEIHIELKTETKMFCRCKASHFGQPPNSCVCPICLGLPGSLPYPNQKAIEWVRMMGLALDCQLNLLSKFDRKNYFYPDLPKGYQISQYELPLCQKGIFKKIRIKRVHLEEDTGKLFHESINGQEVTLIDFNRAGVPLMEIVTEPDISSPAQAKEFLKDLQMLVRTLGISDADMEKGQMRCEPTVNLAMQKDGKTFFTPLVEIKNINSFRFVEKAIDYEIKRQKEEFEKTGKVKVLGNKTTRGWDEKKQQTVLQREKEEAADYRYFPEPDLPPLRITEKEIEILKRKLPELPEQKVIRLMKNYALPEKQARDLVAKQEVTGYFEKAAQEASKQKIDFKDVANMIINKRIDFEKLQPQELVEFLVKKKAANKISQAILEEKVILVIKNNPQAVKEFKKGKQTVVEFLVGQVMKETKGQTDPQEARKILCEKLRSA